MGRSSLNEDDKYELEGMINKKISQGLKDETREKETISFNNAEVAIAQDYDYDPKTYHADAEFRNEEKADKDREKAETLEIKKVLLDGKIRLNVKKHYADAEFRDENNADRDRKDVEDEKDEAKASEEQKNELKAGEEQKSDVPAEKEQAAADKENRRRIGAGSLYLPDRLSMHSSKTRSPLARLSLISLSGFSQASAVRGFSL